MLNTEPRSISLNIKRKSQFPEFPGKGISALIATVLSSHEISQIGQICFVINPDNNPKKLKELLSKLTEIPDSRSFYREVII